MYLSAKARFETFRDFHEMYDSEEAIVRDRIHTERDRLAISSNFFNITSIQGIWRQYRLLPHLSLEYINTFQIRWIGHRNAKNQKQKSSTSSKKAPSPKEFNDDEDKEELQQQIKDFGKEVNRLASLYTKENKLLTSYVLERMKKSSRYNILIEKISQEKKKHIQNNASQWLLDIEEEKNVLWKDLQESIMKADDRWPKMTNVHSDL